MGKVIITERKTQLLLFLLDEKGQAQMIRTAEKSDAEESLGNIYIAKVSEIAAGIHAAFVSGGEGKNYFLPLEEAKEALLVNRASDGTLKCGDELLVQVTAKAVKTKLPTVSTKLSLTGRYVVCRLDGHGINFSKKIPLETAAQLKKALRREEPLHCKKYGFTVRTNAGYLEDITPLLEEMRELADCFEEIRSVYRHRTCYSCLYQSEPEIVTLLKGIPVTEYDRIITDLDKLQERLRDAFGAKADLYKDTDLSLWTLYGLESQLAQALGKKVWLPGGGYLIIEPTEAMVVIDVNSGKGSGGKKNAGLYLKTNLEAAKEIARQLRLRNYSGMIMVDFINMDAPEDNRRLMSALEEYLQADIVKTRLVDMTALGIVEITRKKVSSPLDRSLA